MIPKSTEYYRKHKDRINKKRRENYRKNKYKVAEKQRFRSYIDWFIYIRLKLRHQMQVPLSTLRLLIGEYIDLRVYYKIKKYARNYIPIELLFTIIKYVLKYERKIDLTNWEEVYDKENRTYRREI